MTIAEPYGRVETHTLYLRLRAAPTMSIPRAQDTGRDPNAPVRRITPNLLTITYERDLYDAVQWRLDRAYVTCMGPESGTIAWAPPDPEDGEQSRWTLPWESAPEWVRTTAETFKP